MGTVTQRILQAHGGRALWESLDVLEVELAAWGFLFTAKRIALRPRLRMSIGVQRMEVILHDYPQAGQRTVLLPDSSLQQWDAQGQLLQTRTAARAQFHRLRRQLYWDELDFAYFCAYAMWNYMTMPWLLSRPGVAVQAVENTPSPGLCQLRVEFPPDMVTHSPVQRFYFDEHWHLCRHDYTAEVVGGWAKAAHMCSAYRTFDGLLPLPTCRRVFPTLLGSGPLPWPTLVGLDIHSVQLRRATSPAGR